MCIDPPVIVTLSPGAQKHRWAAAWVSAALTRRFGCTAQNTNIFANSAGIASQLRESEFFLYLNTDSPYNTELLACFG